jgi:hypothetical protein
VTPNHYADALAGARKELDELLQKRADLDKRISTLQITIEGLAALSDPAKPADAAPEAQQLDLQELGITDAIRAVLRESRVHMTAPQIRNSLVDRGYNVDRFASILTVIHNTVKRMHDQGEIAVVHDPSGRFVGWMYQPKLVDQVRAYSSRFNPRDPLGRLNRSRYGGRYQGPIDPDKLPPAVAAGTHGTKKK